MVDRDELLDLLRALEEAAVDYVLIGATAMGFHGVVRATEDVDMLVRAAPENIERLRAALRAAFANDPTVEGIRSEDLLGDYPAVRYYPPRGDLYLDVMTRLGEMASFDSVGGGVQGDRGCPSAGRDAGGTAPAEEGDRAGNRPSGRGSAATALRPGR